MEKDIGKIMKGEYQGTVTEIVIGVREYNGRKGLDIREYTQSEQYTGPTKKGLRIPADKFEEFKTMINSVNPADLATADEPSQETLPVEEVKQPAESINKEDDAGIDEDGLM